ncbi:MAG: RNase adapter RapZ, partial [Peptostreptococcaceae bacterium]
SKFVEACSQGEGKIEKVALVIDIRGGAFFDDITDSFKNLKSLGHKLEILYLEAKDEVLVKRYKETRRKHPLAPEGRIITGISKEKERLREIKEVADNIIDTSKLSAMQLREKIMEIYGEEGQIEKELMITILSFGFKYGIPVDSDLVFDVRFLPNPFYIKELKPLSGNDDSVSNYVMSFDETKEFLDKLSNMLEFLIPYYKREGKRQLIVSIGCTGGRHRSVCMSNKIYESLNQKSYAVSIDHRDINEDINIGANKL